MSVNPTTTKTLTTLYIRGNANDFCISYLVRRKKKLTNDRLPLAVVTESIGDLLCLRRCCIYLHHTFPDRDFTHHEVEKCMQIFYLVLQSATFHEQMDENRLDICFEDYNDNFGIFDNSRKKLLKFMFNTPKLLFPCYNINRQGEPDWLKEKKVKYPEYTLEELLDNEWKYIDFCKYWCNLPNYERCRDALVEVSGLTKDCVGHIYSMLQTSVGSRKNNPLP